MDQKISVIIRTFNSAQTVPKAIESALKQTLPEKNYEVIVLDDGSEDETLKVLQKYKTQVRVLPLNHSGPIEALNYGLKNAADFYTVLDADDTLVANALEVLIEPLLRNDAFAFSYGDYTEIGIDGNSHFVSTKDNIFNTLAGGILFNTSVVLKLGGYDNALFLPEYDLIVRLLENVRGIHVNNHVYNYHRNAGSLTSNQEKVRSGLRQLNKKYGKDFPIRKY